MKMKKNVTNYDDIIRLSHHVSATHPQMPVADRAAQFSPFAALTGHDAAVKETARLTDRRIELDEDQKSILNEKLRVIADGIKECPEIAVTYFVPDEKKKGGSYNEIAGFVKKIDLYKRCVVMEEGLILPIDEIVDIRPYDISDSVE